jgi:hypothetical protein
MWKRLQVKFPLFLSGFNETLIFSTDFRKISNIKFHQSPSSWSRVVPCGRTDGHTDMTKLTIAFRNFANAPKNLPILSTLKTVLVEGAQTFLTGVCNKQIKCCSWDSKCWPSKYEIKFLYLLSFISIIFFPLVCMFYIFQGGSNMTGTICV